MAPELFCFSDDHEARWGRCHSFDPNQANLNRGYAGCARHGLQTGPVPFGERTLSEQIHPMAPHHLPFYLAPGSGTDVLMVVMGIFLVAALVWVGTLYLRLHSLPERMAHKVGEIAVRDRGHFGPAGALHAHPPVLGGGTAACHDRYPRFRYTVAQHRRVSREDSRWDMGVEADQEVRSDLVSLSPHLPEQKSANVEKEARGGHV